MAVSPLQNAWRSYTQEGRLLSGDTRKQIEAFVARLVKEGELRADQVQKAIDEIQKRSQRNMEALQRRIREQLQEELQRIGVATKKDLDRLERKVNKVEKQVSDAQQAAKAAKAAPAAAKKAAASKPAASRAAAKPATRGRGGAAAKRS